MARWAAETGAGGTLVLDRWALDGAGITPATPLPTSASERRTFWEAAGLTAVSWGGGVLLTARSRGNLPPAWEAAVDQADRVDHPQDVRDTPDRLTHLEPRRPYRSVIPPLKTRSAVRDTGISDCSMPASMTIQDAGIGLLAGPMAEGAARLKISLLPAP